jgi:hypothetical protein
MNKMDEMTITVSENCTGGETEVIAPTASQYVLRSGRVIKRSKGRQR